MILESEILLQSINRWIQNKSLTACATSATSPASQWVGKHVISVIVSILEPESYVELLYSLIDHLEISLEGSTCFVTENHICTFAVITHDGTPYQLFLSPISSLSTRKDDPLTKFLEARWTGLKVARDGLAMRTLLAPRLYSLIPSDIISNDAFNSALRFIVTWAKGRVIFDYLDSGYLTQEILLAMLLHVFKPLSPSIPVINLIRTFFVTYADWDYNEASISGSICAPSDPYASTINEDEGIDSDPDDESRVKRIARRMHVVTSTPSPDDQSSDGNQIQHSLKQDEDDEVQVHKRTRGDLGRIRDMRRYYTMTDAGGEYFAKAVGVIPTMIKPLDWLDAMMVAHPFETTEYVNLALRVQESNKKIILQEFLRARMLIEDVNGTDLDLLEKVIAEPVTRGVHTQILVSVESEVKKIQQIVSMYVSEELWFLVQELQAWQGVMVIPPEANFPFTNNTFAIGLVFPSEAPYCATENLKIDYMGPLLRAMARCREKLRRRLDYTTLEHRFSVKCGLKQVG